MVVGESLVIGRNAQFLVEEQSTADIVNVTILPQRGVATIVQWMAPLTWKRRDAMIIPALVCRHGNYM